jgi:hypothetical protein
MKLLIDENIFVTNTGQILTFFVTDTGQIIEIL